MTTTKRKLPSDYLVQGWCQWVLSKDSQGQEVSVDSPSAVQWCVMGAVLAAFPDEFEKQHPNVGHLVAYLSTKGTCVDWNNAPGRTQAEVVAVMLEAEAAVLNPITKEAV